MEMRRTSSLQRATHTFRRLSEADSRDLLSEKRQAVARRFDQLFGTELQGIRSRSGGTVELRETLDLKRGLDIVHSVHNLQYREAGIDVGERPIQEAEAVRAEGLRARAGIPFGVLLRGWIHYSRGRIQDALHELKAALEIDGNNADTLLPLWESGDAALREIDALIACVCNDALPDPKQLALLFAPTGPLQEVSSGWGEVFLELAERIDAAMR